MSGILVEMPSRLIGGCMCGACHCNRCFIKGSTLRLEGETDVFEDIGSSGLRVGRRNCGRCGSPLTTEPDVVPDLMMVKVGGIDNNGCDGALRYPAKTMGGARTGRSAIRW